VSDLVIRERDGWVELDLPAQPSHPYAKPDWDRLWSSIGQGDFHEARLVLEEADVYFTQPGTEGEETFEGKVDFRMVAVPDDMLGESMRVWFKPDAPVEVWAVDSDERLLEGQGASRRTKPRRR